MLDVGTPTFWAKVHHPFIPLMMEEGKERIKYLLPLGSCQDTTDLRRRSQSSRGCDPSRTAIKGVEHRQLFSRGRKSGDKSGAPTYDSIVWSYSLSINWLDPTQPCQEPPCIQGYLRTMYLIVMYRIFPFHTPARSALPSVRTFSPCIICTQVWGVSYDSSQSSILTPPPRGLTALFSNVC